MKNVQIAYAKIGQFATAAEQQEFYLKPCDFFLAGFT